MTSSMSACYSLGGQGLEETYSVFCSREQDVYAARRPQESALVLIVAPNQTDNYHKRLFALEVVNC